MVHVPVAFAKNKIFIMGLPACQANSLDIICLIFYSRKKRTPPMLQKGVPSSTRVTDAPKYRLNRRTYQMIPMVARVFAGTEKAASAKNPPIKRRRGCRR
jgi:hypothetical protein